MTIGSVFADGHVDDAAVVKKHRRRSLMADIYPVMMVLADLMLISAIFGLACWLRYDTELLHAMSRKVLLVCGAISMLGVAMVGGYSYKTNTTSVRFVSEHIIVSIASFIGVFFIIYSFVTYGYQMNSGRSVVALTMVAFPVCSILYRMGLGKVKNHFRKGNALCIIGTGWSARDLYRRLKASNSTCEVMTFDPHGDREGQRLCNRDDSSPMIEPLGEVRLRSSMRGKYVENYVLTCPLEELPSDFQKRLAVAQFSGHKVCSYESYLMGQMKIMPPGKVSMSWALEEGFLCNRNKTYERIKRFGDIMVGLTGLIVFAPVFIVVGILVKLTSPGPIIFKQQRVGRREEPFDIYKFRSMTVRTEEEAGSMYTQKNDPRVTKIGGFLRKTRIDELPQFWNVLKGDLSLIGPRAEWVDLVKGYEQRFPYYHFRHAVKPGITGWAQVNYSYGANDEDTVEKLNYDLYYVRKHSMILDAVIVVKTVYMVLFGRGQ
ncbi:sugar transferase [Oceaniferula flava]|nr:sugar transferase [Oceaniferula flavus]